MEKKNKKIFISSTYNDRGDGIALRQIADSDIKTEAFNPSDPNKSLTGITKKARTNILGTDYILKNHSYIGYEDNTRPTIAKLIKKRLHKNFKLVTAGTMDVRYRFTGTPIDKINLASIRETLTSNLLMAINQSAMEKGKPAPYQVASMQLLIDNYEGTKHPRFQVLSEKTDFTPLDKFVYSAISSEKLPPYKKGKSVKDTYAILDNNSVIRRNSQTQQAEKVELDKTSLAYASILPAILADYDIPGTHGNNIGVTKNKNTLTFFDFGHSIEPSWLKQSNVTSDLKSHDFAVSGSLNNKRNLNFTKDLNLIRQYKGTNVVDTALADKISAFKHIYDTFIDSHTQKENVRIKGIKSEVNIILNQLHKEGVISNHTKRYYRKRTFKSLDYFTNRLKQLHEVLEPRLDLNKEQLAILETSELLSSHVVPSKLSKTGFILRKESPLGNGLHRKAFEIKDGFLTTQSREAAEKIAYFIYKEKGILMTPQSSMGHYNFPLDVIPKQWEHSPFTDAGRQNIDELINNTSIAQQIYLNHPTIFIKIGGIEQHGSENIDFFVDDVLDVVNDIKEKASHSHPSKSFQGRLLYQFLNSPIPPIQMDGSDKNRNNETSQTLWEVLHQVVEKDRDPRSSVKIDNAYQLRMLDKQFAPEMFSNIFEVSNGASKQR